LKSFDPTLPLSAYSNREQVQAAIAPLAVAKEEEGEKEEEKEKETR